MRDMLGERLLDISYSTLTADPETALRQICTFLGLDAPMARAFNEFQARFGFANRASPEGPCFTPCWW